MIVDDSIVAERTAKKMSSLEGLYGRPGFKIRRAHQIAVGIFAEATSGLNVTTSQYGVVHALARMEGLDQITVARLIGLDRSTTSMVLDLLEQRGIIERAQDPSDRRRRILRVTDTGRDLYERAQAPVAGAVRLLMEPVAPDDREPFLDCLEKLVWSAAGPVEPALGRELRDLYRRPGFLIRRAHQLSTARFIEACKPYDMTTTQFGMMFVLNARPNIDQVNLARLAFFDRSTNSMVVDMLANRGWIERRIDPQDRRRRLLSLTGLGTEVLDAVTPATEDVRQALLAGLEQSEQDFLMRCLDLITSALGDANF